MGVMKRGVRTRWTVACALACLAAAQAAPLNGLLACRDIADSQARLACFDREAAALAGPARVAESPPPPAPPAAAAPPPPPAPPAPPAAAAPPGTAAPPTVAAALPAAAPPAPAPAPTATSPLNSEQQFGLPERAVAAKEVAAGTRASDVPAIEAHLVSLAAAPDGRMIFTLDNGQAWRQLQAEGDLLAKPGDTVVVSRALFGSFWMRVPTGRGCKVTRLR
jgi:hypothetical protein